MKKRSDFEFKKVQIENFVKAEYAKRFRRAARISMRKRQRFMEDVVRRIYGRMLATVTFPRYRSVSTPVRIWMHGMRWGGRRSITRSTMSI